MAHRGLANAEWTQPLFPPVPLTNVLQLPALKSFRDESFLRAEYLVEGLSLKKIADLTLSSKRTIRKYLLCHQIPLRSDDVPQNVKQPLFGMRRLQGKLVQSKAESRILEKIVALRESGRSYREIVNILNSLKIPCRKRGAKWHLKTVFHCLKNTSRMR